ncbi:MAG: glycoside hydrolase family 3 C-terminal domain-containing protein [Bryobacteraceae bacterium]
MKIWCLVLLLAFASVPVPGQLYTNPNQPVEKRVEDLLSRMTLEEKASQLLSASPAVERLGIPEYDWWNECLHGVARAGHATVFPETIGMAATWDTDLMLRAAAAISDEARAKHHEFVRRGKRGIYQGLTFWTPNINLFRDPRWGRGMETYGEDPYLTARMAVQFIKGLQGDDPRYLKTVATAKHYAVHSGPESTRHTFDARVSEGDLFGTYLPHFAAAIRDGGAFSVMCAYNSVDGAPACANTRLLDTILRKQWGFTGYVVSDCGAIGDIYQTHKAAKTAAEGVAMAVKAGCDLDCGLEYENIVPAVKQGLLSQKDVDGAVRRLLIARFRLGMFDPPEKVKWAQIPYSVNESPEHQQLALEAARKSIVLLKNQGGLLPLSKNLKTIGVIGPNADSVEVMLGNYNGEPSHPVTPLQGIRQKVGASSKVLYARGSDLAEGMPSFETVPSAALFTSKELERHGLQGEYFNTANFNGRAYIGKAFVSEAMRKAVEMPANPQPLFLRIDPQVEFDWRDGAPRPGMDNDNFGVRWTGYLKPPESGKYQLGATGLNSFEVYLDGRLLVQRDNVHERAYEYQTVELQAGKLYPIRVDFHEVHGDADIRLVWVPPHRGYEVEALRVAKESDVVLMFLGLSPRLEGEEMKVKVEGFSGGDRVRLAIPGVQEALLQRISATGKPVVLVFLNGSAVAVNWARDHVPAIVELWYPGQAGGTALADVLFGDYNPGGRLPVTFYKSEDQLPPFEDYSMKGRTYRFFRGEPLYPFGYGLSYTTFKYARLNAPVETRAGVPVKVSVEVQNTGRSAGEEVVQLYAKHPAVVRELQGFERVSLKPGERRIVELTFTRSEVGNIDLSVGGLSKSVRIVQ